MEELLNIRDLRVWFDVRIGILAGLAGKEQKHVRAVDGISFDVKRGEVFCLVGESGCGKTTTGKAFLRLNEPTGGNIYFDVPEQEWNRLISMEARLRELEASVTKLAPADRRKAERDWSEVRRLNKQVSAIRNPKGLSAVNARRERVEKTIEVMNDREKALREGQDARVKRMTAKDRDRLERMETLGPWFTPPRALRLDRLEAEIKEATYRQLRAEVTRARTGKSTRVLRRLERRLAGMRNHIDVRSPEVQRHVAALRLALEAKTRALTQLELARLETERKEDRARLESLRIPQATATAADLERLEAEIESVRKQGGRALEAFEIRAQVDALRERYDLAAWGRKGKWRLRGRRKRRKVLKQRMRELRRRMQIIYQDPYESLNPKLSIFDIVAEPLLANRVVSSQSEAEAVVAKALEDVGLRPASEYILRYPHELSGGQRQRVGIATALVVDPDFIVADEPVSMLDASVRTEILALLLDLKKRRDLTYLFITHDLGLAWILADRIAVMYLGKIVETGDGGEIIQNPRHPYTKALISVVPSPNPSVHREKVILRGERPNPVDIPTGCRFHPRCPMAVGICGWDADEVHAELEKLLKEDRSTFEEARSVSAVAVAGPFALTLTAPDPARVEAYLRKRLQAVALGRPALGAIRKTEAQSGTLNVTLHNPVEPPLQPIKGNISVACHLVEPEIEEAAQQDAVEVTK